MKKLIMLLIILIIPINVFATYTPDETNWQWVNSRPLTGLFIAKNEPVRTIQATENKILQGYILIVLSTPLADGTSYATENVQVKYSQDGSRYYRVLHRIKYDVNDNVISSKTFNNDFERIMFDTLGWRISDALLSREVK